ncbi:MAG TPA: NAD(P)H-dependent oxidoreductase [Candidatus Saccharimonadales bacterium]|nr:NAD(P)H-dependent oxidoreductase [Candidatus Saccharimonadales bacterium]
MNVQIIVGSTRPVRNGLQIADWLAENLPKYPKITYEIIDLAKLNLPILDETVQASRNQYQNDHTKAWSEIAKKADGFIWLTPEYNAGYSAALKNAIDYLYVEWTDKPIMIVSYGFGGGVTASAQLNQVADRLKMKLTKTSPALAFSHEMIDETGKIKDVNDSFQSFIPSLQTAGDELHDLIVNK